VSGRERSPQQRLAVQVQQIEGEEDQRIAGRVALTRP